MPGSGGRPGGGPGRGRDFAEYVRHALQAAAEQVEPGADGLTPIRARVLAGAGIPWPLALAMSQYWLGPNRKS